MGHRPPPATADPDLAILDLYLDQLIQGAGMRAALIKAQAFIEGFEDDHTQVGVAELLAQIRTALAARSARRWPGRTTRRPFNGPALLVALFALLPFMAGVAAALLWMHAR
jgi:hypothetical protein